MAEKKNFIPVVFITDDNYAMPTTVAITSLKVNRNPAVQYKVFVLAVDIAQEHQEKMLSLGEDGFEVSVLEREISRQMLDMKQVRGRVTPSAMLKFDIPLIFKDYDKILYLDSDVLIERDLSELFHTDITDCYAAVVKDIMTYRSADKHLKWLQFQPEAYFNSGVLLLNLDKMRQDDIAYRLVDYRRYGLNRFTDQDALNVVFDVNVRYISPYYNLLNCFFEWEPIETLRDFYGVDFPEEKEDIYLQATVLHLGDKQKPWKYEMGFLSSLYRSYYDQSPYSQEPLVLKKWVEQISNLSTPVKLPEKAPAQVEQADDRPFITVVMPSLNVAPYIRRCIESALDQSLRNIEILCVDAGSTDGTLEILREYEKQDKRVHVLISDMKSYGHQMNLGIKNAHGKYLAILETDDYILPGMYEELYDIAEKNSLDLIKADYFKFTESDTEGKDIRIYWNVARSVNLPYNKVIDSNENLNAFKSANIPWAGLYNLDFLRQNDIWLNESPGASYQDNGLWFQVLCQAHRVYFYDKPFYCLRRDNPNSSFFSRGKVFAICNEYDFIRNVLKKSPTLEKRFAPLCALYRYKNCMWTLGRIAEEFKLEFYQRFAEDYRAICERGELDESLFTRGELERIQGIMEDPVEYYYEKSKLNYEFFRMLPPERYPQVLQRWYFEKTKEELDLENPITFHEKLQWLKLYDTTPLKKSVADQYLVRNWVKEKVGEKYLVPLLGVWNSFDEIDFDSLPDRFILRGNCGRNYTISVPDKASLDFEDLQRRLDNWTTQNFALKGGLELAYEDVQPKIFAIPFPDSSEENVVQYHFYCMNGAPQFVWVISGQDASHNIRENYNMDWELQASTLINQSSKKTLEKPEHFEEMKKLAAALSEGFVFVDILLYSVNGKIYFGETIFYPQSGVGKWESDYQNSMYGDLIHLPLEKTPLPEKSFAERGYQALPDPPFCPETDVWKVLEQQTHQKDKQWIWAAEVNARRASLDAQLRQRNDENYALNVRRAALDAELRQRNDENYALNARRAALDAELRRRNDENYALNARRAALDAELRRRNDENYALNARLQRATQAREKCDAQIRELKAERKRLKKELAKAKKANKQLKKSAAYRIGRYITWPVRKAKALVKQLTGRGKQK